MTSEPVNGLPALFTVIRFVLTLTVAFFPLVCLIPPMSRLSAPNPLSTEESRNMTPVPAVAPGPPIRISSALLISTTPPRLPAGAWAETEPWMLIPWVAERTRLPASPGRRARVALFAAALCAKKALP